jgi:hypothetical protein
MFRARLRRLEVDGLARLLINISILTHGGRIGWFAVQFSRRKSLRRRSRR